MKHVVQWAQVSQFILRQVHVAYVDISTEYINICQSSITIILDSIIPICIDIVVLYVYRNQWCVVSLHLDGVSTPLRCK